MKKIAQYVKDNIQSLAMLTNVMNKFYKELLSELNENFSALDNCAQYLKQATEFGKSGKHFGLKVLGEEPETGGTEIKVIIKVTDNNNENRLLELTITAQSSYLALLRLYYLIYTYETFTLKNSELTQRPFTLTFIYCTDGVSRKTLDQIHEIALTSIRHSTHESFIKDYFIEYIWFGVLYESEKNTDIVQHICNVFNEHGPSWISIETV